MRKLYKLIGTIALIAAIAFSMAGCPNGTTSGVKSGNTTTVTAKKITITDLNVSAFSKGYIVVLLFNESGDVVAGGYTAKAATITIQLGPAKDVGDKIEYNSAEKWTGTGKYFVVVGEADSEGSSLAGSTRFISTETIDFKNQTTSVAWSKFQRSPSVSPSINFINW
jgi:predicted small secreted protein